jgi:hypothetical protein
MGRVFTQDTINTTGYSKNELILVVARMIRTGVAKDVGDAIEQLDTQKHDTSELLDLVIQSHQQEPVKSEEEEVKVKVR